MSIQAEAVEEIVESYARARLSDPRVRERLAVLRSAPVANAAELTLLEDRIGELERQLDEPGVPVATILGAIDRARTKRDDLMRQVSSAGPRDVPTGGGDWPADLGRRHALVSLVVERVTVQSSTRPGKRFDPERVEIDGR